MDKFDYSKMSSEEVVRMINIINSEKTNFIDDIFIVNMSRKCATEPSESRDDVAFFIFGLLESCGYGFDFEAMKSEYMKVVYGNNDEPNDDLPEQEDTIEPVELAPEWENAINDSLRW